MKYKEFRKEYGDAPQEQIIGMLNTAAVNSYRPLSDSTLVYYYKRIKALTNKKELYKTIVKNIYSVEKLAKIHNMSPRTIETYKIPLTLLNIVETPDLSEDYKIQFKDFKEKFASLSNEQLMNFGRKIVNEYDLDCQDVTIETFAYAIHTISRKSENFYNDLISTNKSNKVIAKKYGYAVDTIIKQRKSLLFFGFTKHKIQSKRNNNYKLKLDDLLNC